MEQQQREYPAKATLRQKDGLTVAVWVMEERVGFGRTDYRVKPVGGEGERWVQESRIEFAD